MEGHDYWSIGHDRVISRGPTRRWLFTKEIDERDVGWMGGGVWKQPEGITSDRCVHKRDAGDMPFPLCWWWVRLSRILRDNLSPTESDFAPSGHSHSLGVSSRHASMPSDPCPLSDLLGHLVWQVDGEATEPDRDDLPSVDDAVRRVFGREPSPNIQESMAGHDMWRLNDPLPSGRG
jgi:hypothetical protein